MVTHVTECRICKNNDLVEVLNLGELHPSGFLKEDKPPIDKVPLRLVRCPDCGLVQLKDTINLDVMYKQQYWYKSALNTSMCNDLEDVVKSIEKRIKLNDGDVIVDIGANDGTLLSFYSNKNLCTVGFDPAPNLPKTNCDYFVNDYFKASYLDKLGKKARVASLIAVFYDIPDPNDFVEQLKSIMDKDGIIVIQMTDLLSMLLLNAIDTTCHEHIETYSLDVLNNLLIKHGLEIFDIEYNTVNGGSLRVYVSFPGSYKVSGKVFTDLLKEKIILDSNYGSFENFINRSNYIKDKVMQFIKESNGRGERTFALGASTKGATLTQYYGIDHSIVPFALEVNEEKLGLKMVGSDMKIISEADGFNKKPNYLLVLPWHFKNMLLGKEGIKKYMENGGKLIFPLPIPEIIGKDYHKYL
jgi:hypothetical protein